MNRINSTVSAFLGVALSLVVVGDGALSASEDCVQYVRPLAGIGYSGCYPGAQAPFGMVAWSPDTVTEKGATHWPGGYSWDDPYINQFSLTHISGAGLPAAMALPLMPAVGTLDDSPVRNPVAYKAAFSHTDEEAEAGYYRVGLTDKKIEVELAATKRAGIGRFTYPASTNAAMIFNPIGSADYPVKAGIRIDPVNRKLTGWTYGGAFGGVPCRYHIYFCAVFDQDFTDYGTWRSETKKERNTTEDTGWGEVAAYVKFDTRTKRTVTMKVGISYVSVQNAESNLLAEIPGWDLTTVRRETRNAWNMLLNRITVEGGTPEQKQLFYTAFYRLCLQPSVFEDVNGEYVGFDNAVHKVAPGRHYYAIFSLWDTYRTNAQLLSLLVPDISSDMVRSLLLAAQHATGGGLPIWSYYTSDSGIMLGYPSLPYIASAYAFGARDFDASAALDKMIDTATRPRYCNNPAATWKYQREYIEKGYVPKEVDASKESVSRTIEYAIADFAVSRFAKALGRDEIATRFAKRAQQVFNLWNPTVGYLTQRNGDGTWPAFNPSSGEGYTEGDALCYTFNVPHNIAGLVRRMSMEKAQKKLDSIGPTVGNEPYFGLSYINNWVKQPWKTQEKIRAMLAGWHLGRNGTPGNDDTGALSAYYMWGAMGLYPAIPGVGGVTVTSPIFKKTRIQLSKGRVLTINAPDASAENKYIQRLSVNGKPQTSTWIDYATLTENRGATIDFTLGSVPNTNWGVGDHDAPPSYDEE